MTRFTQIARIWAFVALAVVAPASLSAAPFAAYVIDARTGQPIYTQNADTPLHPASLTKMMTLYMAFTAIERGQVRLDSQFPVSTNAASEPPSKLGLRAGQKIELRYLLRAAAIKSANDAATAIGEGLAGSEPEFARQMTQMARALGMSHSQFKNANGLTQEGHYSSAHDMTILGRRLFYDFPQYYNLFSRRSADAGIAQVASTNRRFLDAYPGADGIKTGYTRAAGFNLTASAQRGNKRLVATVFGGTSTAQRNQVMTQLLDQGFTRIPSRVREVRPEAPRLLAQKVVRRAQVEPNPVATRAQPMLLSASAAPSRGQRGPAQTASLAATPQGAAPAPAPAPAAQSDTATRLARSNRPPLRPAARGAAIKAAVNEATEAAPQSASLAKPVLGKSARPVAAPRSRDAAAASLARPEAAATQTTPSSDRAVAKSSTLPSDDSIALLASPSPQPRSEGVILAAMGEGDTSSPEALEVVSRAPESGRTFGISFGHFKSQAEADRLLLRSALADGAALDGARRQVLNTKRGFQANLVHLSKADAELVCDRFRTRSQDCTVIGR